MIVPQAGRIPHRKEQPRNRKTQRESWCCLHRGAIPEENKDKKRRETPLFGVSRDLHFYF
jgi:hypothetical protein